MFDADGIERGEDISRACGPVDHNGDFAGKQRRQIRDIRGDGGGKHYAEMVAFKLADERTQRKAGGNDIAV